jgi:hypothetical protein
MLEGIIGIAHCAVKVDLAVGGRGSLAALDRSRWIAFGVVLVVVFFVSMAAGAFIGRQRSPSTPVAVASPSAAPTPSASPTVAPTPSAAPTQTLAPTVPPTASPEPTAPPDTLSAEGFAQELAAAIRGSDAEYLFNHLHPATIERYGEGTCRAHLADFGGDVDWEILGSSGPEAWSYETDGLATNIPDAWTVNVRQPGADPELRELHFAQADETWRWFTDCGDPA